FYRRRVRSGPIASAAWRYARRIVNGNRDLCRVDDRGLVPTSQPASTALTQPSTERGDRKHSLGCLLAPPQAKAAQPAAACPLVGANVRGSDAEVHARPGGATGRGRSAQLVWRPPPAMNTGPVELASRIGSILWYSGEWSQRFAAAVSANSRMTIRFGSGPP